MFRNRKLATLFFTMVVMMLGFGIIIPIMPFYVQHFGAGGTQLGALLALFSVMQFIFSPFWGSLSDRYGRKKVMMIGVTGNALSLLVMGLAQHLWVLFAARAIEGMISAATMPTAMAYISDSTTDEERSSGMGVIGAAMGIGMVLGPGMGGWLSAQSLSFPFFLAASMSFLSLAMIWFVLPESLPLEKRAAPARRFRGPQLSALWQALFGPLGFLMVLAFLVNFALANFEVIFGLFADKRYGYGPAQVGTVMVVVGIISSLVQMLLTGPASRRLGEGNVIKLALFGTAAGFGFMLLAPNNILVPISVGFFVFANAMLRPSIASLTSQKARGGHGAALGLNNSFQSLGRAVGPIWAGSLFDLHMIWPYLSGAIIVLLAFLFSLFTMRAEAAPAESLAPAPSLETFQRE